MADPEKATKVENGIEDEDVEDEEVSTNAKAAMVAELLKKSGFVLNVEQRLYFIFAGSGQKTTKSSEKNST